MNINIESLNENLDYQITAFEMYVSAGIMSEEEAQRYIDMLKNIKHVNKFQSGNKKYLVIEGKEARAYNSL